MPSPILFLYPKILQQTCTFDLDLVGILRTDSVWDATKISAVVKNKKKLSLYENLEFTAEMSTAVADQTAVNLINPFNLRSLFLLSFDR